MARSESSSDESGSSRRRTRRTPRKERREQSSSDESNRSRSRSRSRERSGVAAWARDTRRAVKHLHVLVQQVERGVTTLDRNLTKYRMDRRDEERVARMLHDARTGVLVASEIFELLPQIDE